MDAAELERVYATCLDFHARFARHFGRREARERSEQYLRGLLVQRNERRSAENLAEAVPGASARTLQMFLSDSTWSSTAVVNELHAYVSPGPGTACAPCSARAAIASAVSCASEASTSSPRPRRSTAWTARGSGVEARCSSRPISWASCRT